jgi:superfamily I DNA/RNA helicase
MDIPEIRGVAIDSAEKYYQYLERNDKGLQEVEVYDIVAQHESELVYKLRLSAKLFDIDAVFFKLYHTNRLYNTGEIKVVEYDADKNVLIVKPGVELIQTFKRLPARDIKVISDLKFLVERIKKWYETKGRNIGFPKNNSVLQGSFAQIRYLPGLEPSANQKNALLQIFQAPFSYIWGAPGTGKTQFVLAYAILHYIKNKKRIAILAPTNNAIEQVLRGVLKMTEKASVPRSQILRIGVPSRKFAEEYAEVCEERGIMKKLEELDKQIDIYCKLVAFANKRDQLKAAYKQLSIFSMFDSLDERVNQIRPEMEKSQAEFIKAQSQTEVAVKVIADAMIRQKVLQQKINSFGAKMAKLFSSRLTKAEVELQKLEETLIELRTKEYYWQTELKEKELSYSRIKEEFINAESNFRNQIAKVKGTFDFTEELRSIVSPLTEKNKAVVYRSLEKQIKEELAKLQDAEGLFQEYKLNAVSDLQKHLDKLSATKNKIAAASTEERLKGVNVIACTLDGYVGRFTETKLEVDHVFMDEAGYANIIKALTLFNLNVPVTFLGDHMQLPPVCEINDSEIRQNPEYCNVFLWAQSAIFLEQIFTRSKDILLKDYLENTPRVVDRMQQANLVHTYRFGKKLASILDAHVYTNGFTSSLEDGDTKVYYVHAAKTEPFKSRISANEVQAIRNIVDQFSPEEDFVILTPYKKQVQSLGRSMPKERNELKILTVHGSQGREWDTVILSVVDTGDKWFVDSKLPLSNGLNLLNTAVSRTKKRLIIVCDFRYWKDQSGQLVTDLLSEAEEMRIVN